MEFKLIQLMNLRGPLQELAEVKMSPRAAYRIQGILNAVQAELEKIEAFRKKLGKRVCEEAGKPDADEVPPEKLKEFSEEFSEFLENENVEVAVRSIDVDVITGDISPGTLAVLVEHGIVVGPEEQEDGSD